MYHGLSMIPTMYMYDVALSTGILAHDLQLYMVVKVHINPAQHNTH